MKIRIRIIAITLVSTVLLTITTRLSDVHANKNDMVNIQVVSAINDTGIFPGVETGEASITYGYNKNGLLKKKTIIVNGKIEYDYKYKYKHNKDKAVVLDNVYALYDKKGNIRAVNGRKYKYDKKGRLKEMIQYGSKIKYTYYYNKKNQIIKESTLKNGEKSLIYYCYDSHNNVISLKDESGVNRYEWKYIYDTSGNVSRVEYDDGWADDGDGKTYYDHYTDRYQYKTIQVPRENAKTAKRQQWRLINTHYFDITGYDTATYLDNKDIIW